MTGETKPITVGDRVRVTMQGHSLVAKGTESVVIEVWNSMAKLGPGTLHAWVPLESLERVETPVASEFDEARQQLTTKLVAMFLDAGVDEDCDLELAATTIINAAIAIGQRFP